MKKVLMVAYHYPPDPAVGGVRTARFARYLPQCGWAPIVVTHQGGKNITRPIFGAKTTYHGKRELVESTNGLQLVYRVRALPGIRSTAQWVSRVLLRKGADADPQWLEHGAGYSPPSADTVSPLRRNLYAAMWLPDDRHGWFLPAVLAGLRAIAAQRPSVVYSSGPPWTCHLAGAVVSLLAHLPFVADFRDPWVGSAFKPDFVRTRWSDRSEEMMESWVVRRSKLVICNTKGLLKEMLARYGDLDPNKFEVIPNGFDPEEVLAARVCSSEAPVRSDSGPVIIAYAGTLYGSRDPRPLLEAAACLKKNGAPPFRLQFIGNCDMAFGMPLAELAKKFGLSNEVEVMGPLRRHECLVFLDRADVLLLLAMGQPNQVPAKLYEYIGLGKPVLALAEDDSETAEIVRRSGAGAAADWRDAEAVRKALLSAVTGQLRGCSADSARDYDGRLLTERLAEALSEVSGS
ncbi:MAG: glycosyltransferase family 4 protein [Armatimonadota bacterium]